MSLRYCNSNQINRDVQRLKKNSIYEQELELEKTVKNFISSMFLSAINQKNEENQEKHIVSKFISSLIEEAEAQIIVTNFLDSVFKDAKREFNECEKKNNKNPLKQSLQNNECIFSSSNKIIFNISNTNCSKNNEKVNRIYNPIKEYYSSLKCAKTYYCNYDKSCDSNVYTFSKDDNNKAMNINDSNKRHPKKIKNKRISIICDNVNPGLCSKFGEKVKVNLDKMKQQDNLSIMKTQISDMKKKKEVIANKLSFLKRKKEKKNKKENEILQKILLYNMNQMKSHLDMKKEISNNSLNQYLVNENVEIINKYIQTKKGKKEANNKMRVIKQQKNNNVRNSIKEIKVLKDNYKNVGIKRKVFLNKSKDMKVILGIRKYLEKQKFLNVQKKTLRVEINGKANNLRKNAKVNVHIWRKYKY